LYLPKLKIAVSYREQRHQNRKPKSENEEAMLVYVIKANNIVEYRIYFHHTAQLLVNSA
jgi:hypothetical protein